MGLMFHVDESADSAHHIHAGVLLEARDAAAASAALDDIVRGAYAAGVCPYDAELHATEIVDAKRGWKGDAGARFAVLEQTLEVLALHNIEVITHGANLRAFEAQYGKDASPYKWEFSNLLERLNERLHARDEYAVVIADQHDQYRDTLQAGVLEMRGYGTGGYRHQKLSRVVDTVHFVDSKLSRMTQLADVVAYVYRRRRSVPTEKDPRAEALAQRLDALITAALPEPKGKFSTIRF